MKELIKRMAALLLAAAVVIGFFPALSRAETAATEISSLEEITDLAGSYILTDDTTVTAPIGSSSTPFTGSFNGNGKTITVNITATANYAGIFAAIGEGATVTNFKIANSTVATTGKYSYLGLVTGSCAGTISNVVVENSTVQGYALVGGIVGFLDATGAVTACAVESGVVEKTVEYSSDSYYGGIAGDSEGTISQCSNGATVANKAGSASRGYFGGIAGRNVGTISDSYNFGTVNTAAVKAYRTGGIAGHNDGTIQNSHNVGLILVESSTLTSAKAAIACLKTWGTVGTTANCYYLDTCGVSDTKATAKTALEFKTLAAALSESWADGKAGYPVLSWQTWKLGGSTVDPTEGTYTVEHYTENLDGNGYTLAATTAGDTPAGETATAEATELEGFTFDEANENNLTTGTVTEDGSLVLKLYYSRNSYTLTWDVGEGSITGEEGSYTSGSVKFEAPITAPEAKREGYALTGWTPAIETMPAQDVTLTALWQQKIYDVIWDANGGNVDPTLWTGAYGAEAGARYGEALKKSISSAQYPYSYSRSLPTPTHESMFFVGWFTEAEGGEAVTGDTIVTEPENDVFTFYAHWEAAYTVTLDPNGGTIDTATYLVAQNQPFGSAVSKLPSPTLKYYHSLGWFNGEEELTLDTVITADVTYAAQWAPNTCTAIFHANGGEGTMENQTYTYGEEQQPLRKCTFTREGYIFAGWGTYSAASRPTYADEQLGVLDPTSNGRTYNLYAVWTACTHTMDYVDNGDGTHDYVCSVCGMVEADNEAHTFENGSCACGAEEVIVPADPTQVEIKISHSVSFDSDLKMNYRIKYENIASAVPNYVTEGAYLVVEKDQYLASGETAVDTVTLYPDLTTDAERMLFNLSGIQSVEMGSELRAVLHIFDADGKEYVTPVDAYSVLAYAQLCYDSYTYAAQPQLYTMLIDALNYGSAAQTYFGRRADQLVNAGMDAYQQYATTALSADLTDSKDTVTNDRSITAVTAMGFSVTFADKTEMNAKLTIADGYTKDDITCVKVLDANGNEVDTLTDFTELSDGRLQVTYYGVKSIQMRDMFYFVAYVGDQMASDNIGYSVEAYAKSNVGSTNAALAEMALKCIYYGDAAYAYFNR